MFWTHFFLNTSHRETTRAQTRCLGHHSRLIAVHLRSPVETNVAMMLSQGHFLAPSSNPPSVWSLCLKYNLLLLQMVGGVQHGCLGRCLIMTIFIVQAFFRSPLQSVLECFLFKFMTVCLFVLNLYKF